MDILGSWHTSGVPFSSFTHGITQCWGVFYRAAGRQARGKSLTNKELLGFTSGPWLWVCPEQGKNVTVYLNPCFYEWFPCSVSCMKCASSPHQKCIYLATEDLAIHTQGMGNSSVAVTADPGKNRGDWWKWKSLDIGGVWWLHAAGNTSAPVWVSLGLWRKWMEGKADTWWCNNAEITVVRKLCLCSSDPDKSLCVSLLQRITGNTQHSQCSSGTTRAFQVTVEMLGAQFSHSLLQNPPRVGHHMAKAPLTLCQLCKAPPLHWKQRVGPARAFH